MFANHCIFFIKATILFRQNIERVLRSKLKLLTIKNVLELTF